MLFRSQTRTELRRLQRELGTTTVYVTHDQAEAMTTADLIAVMNHGKVEQLGTPQQIYDSPRSEFVARFIGGSNVLVGTALDQSLVSIAGSRSTCPLDLPNSKAHCPGSFYGDFRPSSKLRLLSAPDPIDRADSGANPSQQPIRRKSRRGPRHARANR